LHKSKDLTLPFVEAAMEDQGIDEMGLERSRDVSAKDAMGNAWVRLYWNWITGLSQQSNLILLSKLLLKVLELD